MEIILTSNKHGTHTILIDDEDFPVYQEYAWYLWGTHRHTSLYVLSTNCVNKPSKRLHRVIMKAKPGEIIDHINGNALDNRKSNLRITNSSDNNMNAKKRKNAKHSKYKGVSKRNNKDWIVQIQYNKIKKAFGPFETEEEAARVYDEKALKYFGEYAVLNFPKAK